MASVHRLPRQAGADRRLTGDGSSTIASTRLDEGAGS